jgi:hypothetical protein
MPSRATGRLALRASWRVGCGDADRAGQAAALDLDRLRGVRGTRCRSTWTGLSGGGSRGGRSRGRAAGTSRRGRVASLVQARVRAVEYSWPCVEGSAVRGVLPGVSFLPAQPLSHRNLKPPLTQTIEHPPAASGRPAWPSLVAPRCAPERPRAEAGTRSSAPC